MVLLNINRITYSNDLLTKAEQIDLNRWSSSLRFDNRWSHWASRTICAFCWLQRQLQVQNGHVREKSNKTKSDTVKKKINKRNNRTISNYNIMSYYDSHEISLLNDFPEEALHKNIRLHYKITVAVNIHSDLHTHKQAFLSKWNFFNL